MFLLKRTDLGLHARLGASELLCFTLLGCLLFLSLGSLASTTFFVLTSGGWLIIFLLFIFFFLFVQEFIRSEAIFDTFKSLLLRSFRESLQTLIKELDRADMALVGHQSTLLIEKAEQFVGLLTALETVWQNLIQIQVGAILTHLSDLVLNTSVDSV